METTRSENEKVKTSSASTADENVACQECGAFGAHPLGDQFLCMNCYQEKGSCCPGGARDDCAD